ncbi:hypothetical protein IW147_001442 [Coemansia sp. RSA 720]|nr:hypothetical protein IW147_001442 [Coemansia sp. RSA 720]
MARPEQADKMARLGFGGSPFSQPGEKTAVGRSGVFYEYRRHSMDMGYESRGEKRAADSDSDGSVSPVRGVATAEKPYACDQCELTFSRQHNLKSHALTHSTERPFACSVCQTPFRRQHDLKRHMKLHTGEKPYKCTNCGRSFARLDALNRHMRAENFHACSQAAKKARPEDAERGQWHWTHRPSMAADEAVVRRMHERFGAPPAYARPSVGSSVTMPAYGARPERFAYGAQAESRFAPAEPRFAPAESRFAQTESRFAPTAPQYSTTPMQPQQLQARHPGKTASPAQPQGAEFARYAAHVRSGAERSAWHTGLAGPAVRGHPQAPIRLPPIELVPPRRHSLAVTSHLERYRARDASPPPGAQAPLPPPATAVGVSRPGETTPRLPVLTAPSTPGSYARAQQMEPVPEDREPTSHTYASQSQSLSQNLSQGLNLSQNKPESSFVASGSHSAHEPAYLAPRSRPTPDGYLSPASHPKLDGYSMSAGVAKPDSYAPSAAHTKSESYIALPGRTKPDVYVQQPSQTKPDVYVPQPSQTKTDAYAPQPSHAQPDVYSTQPSHAKPDTYLTPPNASDACSRRSSLVRASPLAETRRSSIIALTHPSDDDMRQENADLRRRLSELETRHAQELERLHKTVHDLEIEKTLLKNMLLEKGASVPASPLARLQGTSLPSALAPVPRSAP